jgi:hypothetical protein
MSHNFQRYATHAPEIEFQIPIWSYLGFTTFYVEKSTTDCYRPFKMGKKKLSKQCITIKEFLKGQEMLPGLCMWRGRGERVFLMVITSEFEVFFNLDDRHMAPTHQATTATNQKTII